MMDDSHPHPSEWFHQRGKGAIRKEWVPQTMGDQIWLFYEFENANDRAEFVRALPKKLRSMVEPDTEYFMKWFAEE
jgi:hypothetical protein